MSLLKIILFSFLIYGCKSQLPASTSMPTCRIWCQVPSFYPWEAVTYYCCDSQVKPGSCPPLRLMCTETLGIPESVGNGETQPPICQHDNQCAGDDKCCYDQCLLHCTCKPVNS
ncbi:hypothetical protein L9F63_013507 [Diploptera punctata]|uniref:WAP domain-containing protein n=1 Tax=Diploptera punctata TaxID=6984 RepID=A0AAD8EM10_DIPPU|nr:hypothetical protein L9F63_013507 [Diploptera punctata]